MTMDRDPKNFECTRDPIFLLQSGRYVWLSLPDGLESDGESIYVHDRTKLEPWVADFIYTDDDDFDQNEYERNCVKHNRTNEDDVPYVLLEWNTESVFLTRDEAEAFAKSHAHRWKRWQVYCVPCDGELAKILNEHKKGST